MQRQLSRLLVGMGTHSSTDTWKISGGLENSQPMKFQLRQDLKIRQDSEESTGLLKGNLGNVQVCSVLSSLSLMFWEQGDRECMHSKRYWGVRLTVKSLLETDK